MESKLLSGVEQSPVEERASTTLVDVGDSESIILENAFKRKLRTQAATDSTRMVSIRELNPPRFSALNKHFHVLVLGVATPERSSQGGLEDYEPEVCLVSPHANR